MVVVDLDRIVRAGSERVYFAGRDGFVKIGTTRHIAARLRALDKGSCAPRGMSRTPVTLLAIMPGGHKVESALHEMFRPLLYELEWFLAAPPLTDFVAAVAAAGAYAPGVLPPGALARDVAEPPAKPTPPAVGPGRDVLGDTLAVLTAAGRRTIHWCDLTRLLAERDPAGYGAVGQNTISALMRSHGVPSENIHASGVVRRGCKRERIEQAALARV